MSGKTSELIPVRKADIQLGIPLPWAVYNAERRLLLNKGVVVSTANQLEVLSTQGLFRDRRESAGGAVLPGSLDQDGADKARDGGDRMALEDIKLTVGDALQLQSLVEGQGERFAVRLVGMMKPKSVLVTAPVIDGKLIFIREGQSFLVRAFAGLNVCAFKAAVLKTQHTPFPYLHLSYPESVRAMRVRKAVRAPVNLITSVLDAAGARGVGAGRIVDLSVSGARLLAGTAFGSNGDAVTLSFKVNLDDIEEYVQVPAIIRSVSDEEDENKKPVKAMGLQFGELSPQTRLVLMSLIYQQVMKESA